MGRLEGSVKMNVKETLCESVDSFNLTNCRGI
jgi:hypothetical protein